MRVSVFGLGYVGTVTAACLAGAGHQVVGVDVKASKVEAINAGHSPIAEPGLPELIGEEVRAGRLRATSDAGEAILHADVAIICVGTPSDAHGNVSTMHVERVCSEVAHALRGTSAYKLVVLRSTLLPGVFMDRMVPLLESESGKRAIAEFGVAVSPEFLREGSAIADFRNPPFSVIGQTDQRSGDLLEDLYAGIPGPVFRTDPDTAAMVKYASNAFHALKIGFANEVGQLCKALDIDGTEVMNIFCQDRRLNISTSYLKPGFAFGGSCLPKDLRALLYFARHRDLQLPILEGVLPSNRLLIQRTVDRILADSRRRVGVIGLTFKPGTDDLRESPMVELVEMLSGKGFQVRIYDESLSLPALVGANKAYIDSAIPHLGALMCVSMEEVVENSDIVVVAHNYREGRRRLLAALKPDQLVLDFVKFLDRGERAATAYEGISW